MQPEEYANIRPGSIPTVLSLWKGEFVYPGFSSTDLGRIMSMVAQKHGMTVTELVKRTNQRRVAWARQEVMWMARHLKRRDGTFRYSYPYIARRLGLQDHTTVIHGVRQHAKRLAAG